MFKSDPAYGRGVFQGSSYIQLIVDLHNTIGQNHGFDCEKTVCIDKSAGKDYVGPVK